MCWAAWTGPSFRSLVDVFASERASHPFQAPITNPNVAISHLKSIDIDSHSLDGAWKGKEPLGRGGRVSCHTDHLWGVQNCALSLLAMQCLLHEAHNSSQKGRASL